jgi:hypothetical protein
MQTVAAAARVVLLSFVRGDSVAQLLLAAASASTRQPATAKCPSRGGGRDPTMP